MTTLTGQLAIEKNKLASTSAWIMLVEVQLDATTAVRLAANYDAPVTFQGVTWYPFNVEVGALKSSTDGAIQGAEIKASNVTRVFMSYLDAGQIVGKRCRIWIYSVAAADGYASDFVVTDATASDRDLAIAIGLPNPAGQPAPSERFLRDTCRYLSEYGDSLKRCGYDKTLAGALASCDGTLDGANGCAAHGADETARGIFATHPGRFGAFQGLPQGIINV